MSWEDICSVIQRKIEKAKLENGDTFTITQLEQLVTKNFYELKELPFFEDHFEGQSEDTLELWLNKINARLKSIIVTSAEPDNVLSDSGGFDKWINPKRIHNDEWNYWSRYLNYLRRIGRPLDVLSNTERSTLEIVERLGDPHAEVAELQKGLVLGAVQSGKTANFNGVINRAIDLGYDLIIVFSGIMDDLRTQTQKRINSDVIGLGKVDSGQQNQAVGVGLIANFSNDPEIFQIESLTSESYDFNKKYVDSNIGNRKIMVCKKNHSVLANILYWIKTSIPSGQDKLDKSLLILDDEADNASLNNLGHKGIEYASKINGHIRALSNLFKRRSYLGYTATPFANILQDQNAENAEKDAWNVKYRINGKIEELSFTLAPSLFPDKFIYKLNPPSSYIGPKQFFSFTSEETNDLKLPLIVRIEDHNEVPADHNEDYNLSRSMRDAIDCFILSIALRESRNDILKDLPGYSSHHSMLIHTTRLIDSQIVLASNVSKYIKQLYDKINLDGLSQEESIYRKLELQWNRFFQVQVSRIQEYLPAGYNTDGLIPKAYDEISRFLPHAIANLEVKAVNSKTKDKLEYKGESKKYIAVGGNRLSRGFTLEGLTVNYFLRNTNYYDALLQMGRWFGYRPGYIDACRLFIDEDTESKYDFVNETLHELEVLIESMEAQKKSPREFEIRIKKHPDVLKITRPSILKNANEIKFSYSASHKQSTIFTLKPETLSDSWNDFKHLVSTFNWNKEGGFYKTVTDIEGLFKFMDIRLAFSADDFETRDLKRYIKLCNENDKLKTWTIAIKNGGSERRFKCMDNDLDVKGTERRGPEKDDGKFYNELITYLRFTASQKSKNIITAGDDESLGLSDKDKDAARREFRKYKEEKFAEKDPIEMAKRKAEKITIPGHIYYKYRSEMDGLLLIYLIDLEKIFKSKDGELEKLAKDSGIAPLFNDVPLIGYAISFPQINNDPGGEYAVNMVTKDIIGGGSDDDNEVPFEELPDDIDSDTINIEYYDAKMG